MKITKALLKYGFLFSLIVHFLLPIAAVIGGVTIRAFDFIILPLCFWVLILKLAKAIQWPTSTKIDKWLIYFILCIIITTFFSANFNNSLNAALDLFRCFSAYLVLRVLLFNNFLQPDKVLNYLAKIGCVLVLIGLIQYITNSDFGYVLKYFGESTEAAYEDAKRLNVAIRVRGTVKNTNIFGQWIGILLFTYSFFRFFKTKGILKLNNLFWFSLSLIVMMATISRGVLLYAAASTLIVLYFQLNLQWKMNFIVFVIPTLLVIALILNVQNSPLIVNYFERNISGDALRGIYLFYASEIIQKPKIILLGTGLNSLFPALVEYQVPTGIYKPWLDHSQITDSVHNVFIKILVEMGIFSFIVFVRFYFSLIKEAWKWAKNQNDSLFLAVFLGLFIPLNVYNSTLSYYVWLPVLVLVAVFIQKYYLTNLKSKNKNN